MAKNILIAYNRYVRIFLLLLIFCHLGFAQEQQSKSFDLGSVKAVQIDNFLGPITVSAGDVPRVTVRKYDFVPSCHLITKFVDGTIVMKATKEEKLFSWADVKSCRVEVFLEMPSNIVMYLKSKKGDLTVEGMSGDITFDVDFGNALIDGKLDNITGVVRTGDITVNGARNNISLKTFSGDIQVRYDKVPFSAELDLISKRGNIQLFLPKESKLTGSWLAPRGKLVSDFQVTKTAFFNVHLEAQKGNLFIKAVQGR